MRDLDHNIKFSYLYRDAGNYKQYGFEVFSNLTGKTISDIENSIKEKLVDAEFFNAKLWNLNELYYYEFNEEIDHNWHEFEKVEMTIENVTKDIDIEQFIKSLK